MSNQLQLKSLDWLMWDGAFPWLPSLEQTPVFPWTSYQVPSKNPTILDGHWPAQATESLSGAMIIMSEPEAALGFEHSISNDSRQKNTCFPKPFTKM